MEESENNFEQQDTQQDSGDSNFGQRDMHKTTCSECGKECEVPFKPSEGRPVFCRDCYRKKRRY